ncbi:hypothetical protein OEA41_003652 [Lepraria neglecta]|uniref:Uncharacterized protein n=1 Tax=Lepraria neglecta TaxID=209136 RepID=A0AAE0DLN1_9LECA|nr:hypothetical protein OEA41_003652 [Lepraria neglecta]
MAEPPTPKRPHMDPFFTAKLRNYINVCTSDSSETPPAASTPEELSTQVKQANQALDVSQVPTNLSSLKPGSRMKKAKEEEDSAVQYPEPEADKNKGKEPTILTNIEEEDPVAWLDKRVEALKVSNTSSTGIESNDSAAPIPKNWPPPSFINDMIAKYAGQQTHPPPKFALRPLPIEQVTSSSTLPIESASSSPPTPSDLLPGFDPLALPQIPLPAADLAAENARLKARIAQADALPALNTIQRALSQPPIRRTRNSRTFEISAWTAFRLGRIMAGHAGRGVQQNPFQGDAMVRGL